MRAAFIPTRLKVVAAAVVLVLVAAAPHYFRSRPPLRCGLPGHEEDYNYGKFSRTVRTLSATPPIPVRAPLPLDEMIRLNPSDTVPKFGRRPPHAIKAFQFVENPKLQIDHCSISQMSLQLLEDGHWFLTLRADQNPRPTEFDARRKVTTKEEPRLFTEHLQRNEFHVRVQCYAGFGTGNQLGPVGKPVVIPLKVDPFWVQKGRPRSMYIRGFNEGVEEFFNIIDRVEIEFFYRVE